MRGNWKRRRQYVVDRRLQLTLAAQILGVLAGVAVLYATGIVLLVGADGAESLTGAQVLAANAIYLALALAILFVVGLLLTHRVAGPAFVIERAVRALARGEHDARLTLRRRDHLKSLAGAVEELAGELERRSRAADELREALERGDVDRARELAGRLAPAPAREPEPLAK